MSALLDPILLFRVFKPSDPPASRAVSEKEGGGGGRRGGQMTSLSTLLPMLARLLRRFGPVCNLCATCLQPVCYLGQMGFTRRSVSG